MSAIPAGYKQTEVGVIPEDWSVSAIREIFRLGRGRVISHREISRNPGPFPVYSSQTSQNGEMGAISSFDFEGEYVTWTTDGANAGTVFYRNGKFNCTNVCGTAKPLNPETTSPIFFAYFLDTIAWKAVSHVGNPKLMNGPFGEISVVIPSSREQRAIAAALSDVDALLAKLDQLIAKKRDLKQAAMQQLLTGQTRLPGFSGAWEVRRLGDVADIDPENLGSNTASNYEFNYISLEDVDCGALKSWTEQIFFASPSRARRKLRAGDVLVSTVRPSLQSHLHFKVSAPHWVCSTGFAVVRCNSDIANPAYVFPHLFGAGVSRQIDMLLTGSNYPAINSRDVRALEIPIPSYEEQTAIATVLSDMDAELAALEARRDKTRALKQGMMQELLTGRIRLV